MNHDSAALLHRLRAAEVRATEARARLNRLTLENDRLWDRYERACDAAANRRQPNRRNPT